MENLENKNKTESEKIAKVIASSGLCSRRDAEKLVLAGRVKIDNQIVTNVAIRVIKGQIITVDDKRVAQKPAARLWLFHKPRGCLTTNHDPEGRQTIFDFLPKNMPRVMTIGRLDYNTEGLLLLTNDGSLARKMELPENAMLRVYKVRAFGKLYHDKLQKIKNGVTIDGIKYRPAELIFEDAAINNESENMKKEGNFWFLIKLTEGKNREVRKLLEYADLQVNRLIRMQYGKYYLGDLQKAAICEVI